MKNSTLVPSLIFVLLWNSGFIAAEYAIPYAGPFTLLFWRYGLQVILLLAFLGFRGRMRWPGLPAVGLAFVVGILAHGVWLSCGFLSMA